MLDEANQFAKEKLNDDIFREIVNLIPEDWLHWNDTDETPEEIREVYFQFLKTRLENSEIFVNEAKMQEDKIYEYAVIRLVPKVEREEFFNIGLVMFSKKEKYIRVEFHLCPDKFALMHSKLDYEDITQNLISFQKIAKGDKTEGLLPYWRYRNASAGLQL